MPSFSKPPQAVSTAMHKINKCVSVNLPMKSTAMRKLNKPLQQAVHKHAPNTLWQQKLKKREQAKKRSREWLKAVKPQQTTTTWTSSHLQTPPNQLFQCPRRFPVHDLKQTCKKKTNPYIMMMKWCLMSSDVSWHIRDELRPMPKHGSI